MPGIKALVKLVSDDVCVNLAQSILTDPEYAGVGNVTTVATVSGVSGATPMVVHTATPHGLQTGAWVTIFGCIGHLDPTFPAVPDPPAFDLAINGAWQITVIDATHFSVADGVTPGVPNGAYFSAGTVVTGPLVDGHILLGQQHIAEGSAPPRIVFILSRSEWPSKGMWNPSTATPPPDARTQKIARSIWTELYCFEVHAWGQFITVATPQGDPEGGDKDVTQLLYQQVIRSIDQMCRGNWDILPGRFTKEQPGSSMLGAAGEEFVFVMKIGSPIPENFLEFVQSGTKPVVTFSPNPSTG